MIDIKELRYGNYVSVSENYKDIGDLLILDQSKFETLIVFKAYNRVYPIPLTEEWLHRFGFEMSQGEIQNEGDSVYMLNDSDDESFYLSFGEDSMICIHGFGGLHYVDSVHELQNLYAILGIKELTINVTDEFNTPTLAQAVEQLNNTFKGE